MFLNSRVEKHLKRLHLRSLGLVVAPRIRFLKRQTQGKETSSNIEENRKDEDEEVDDSTVAKKPTKLTPFQKKLALLNKKQTLESTKTTSETNDKPINFYEENDEDGDLLFKVKQADVDSSDQDSSASDADFDFGETKKKIKVKTKASIVKKLKKKNIKINEKVLFDEEGNVSAFCFFREIFCLIRCLF